MSEENICVLFSVRRVSFKFVWACVGMGDIVGGMYIVVCVLSSVWYPLIAGVGCGIADASAHSIGREVVVADDAGRGATGESG